MIKKIILISLLVFVGATISSAFQDSPIIVTMQIIKKGDAGNTGTKTPEQPLYILQDGYILEYPSFEVDMTLELRDVTGFVSYSTSLLSGSSQIVLPSMLTGTYEILLYPDSDDFFYYGYIVL